MLHLVVSQSDCVLMQDAELKPAQEDKAAAGAKSQGKKKRKKGRR